MKDVKMGFLIGLGVALALGVFAFIQGFIGRAATHGG
jgi:hypothetical protein